MSDRTMDRGVQAARRSVRDTAAESGRTMDVAMNAGMAWWDLMLRMQRASLASFSVYSPGAEVRISGSVPRAGAGTAEGAATRVIPVGEERLNVATRTELGETTRIRRRVVATPVEQEVTLRDERVVIERRPARTAAAAAPGRDEAATRGEVLTETVIEMSDSRQVPQVWKSVHVAEEIVLRREVTERKERVRETLRRDVVEVEHDEEGPGAAGADNGAVEVMPRRGPSELEAARQRTEALADAARHAMVNAAAAATPGGPPKPPRAEAATGQPEPAPSPEAMRRGGADDGRPQGPAAASPPPPAGGTPRKG